GTLQRVNAAFAALLGRPGDILAGQPLTTLAHEDDAQTLGTRWKDLADQSARAHVEARFAGANGRRVWLALDLTPHSAAACSYAAVEDITDVREGTARQELVRVVSQLCLNSDDPATIFRTVPRLLCVQLHVAYCLLERYDPDAGTLALV